MIKKLLASLVFGFLTSLSYGQCTQQGGSDYCEQAKSYWTVDNISRYETFEDLVANNTALACNVLNPEIYPTCYLQTSQTSPPLPPPGRTKCDNSCNDYTRSIETSDNTAGRLVVTGLHGNGYSYGQYAMVALHIRTCPANTVSVVPDSSKSVVLCQYQPTTYATPLYTPCPTCAGNMRGKGRFGGDPVDIATGIKTVAEVDYTYQTAKPFVFRRFYSSMLDSWRTEYSRTLSYTNISDEIVTLNRHNFQYISFKKIAGLWVEQNTHYGVTLTQNGNDFTVMSDENEKEEYLNITYSLAGSTQFQLKSIKYSDSSQVDLYYSSDNLLQKATDSFGNEFAITSSKSQNCPNNLVTSLTDPQLNTTSYQYDNSNCRLQKITYPDATAKTFVYGTTVLNKTYDENNNLYDWSKYYLSQQKGVVVEFDALGDNSTVNKTSHSFTANGVRLVDANNNAVDITTNGPANDQKITGYSRQCSFCTGEQGSSLGYNSNGYLSNVTDFNNNTTTYTYTP